MLGDESSIDFTTEELVLLGELTGHGLPVGVGQGYPEDMPAEVRQYLEDAAHRALLARRVLTDGSGAENVSVTPAVDTLLEVTGKPGVLVTCARETDGIVETRFLCAVPDIGVEHIALAPSVHRLVPFRTRELLARVLRFADVRPTNAASTRGFELSLEALSACGTAILEDGLQAAVQVLVGAGIDEDAALAFSEALRDRRATLTATVLHKPAEDQVAGGSLTWLDGGMRGLWMTEPVADEEHQRFEIRPASADDLMGELLSYLPGPFAESETT